MCTHVVRYVCPLQVWGSTTSSWSSSNLLQVGTIAQGLTDAELSAITYTNDIVSSFAKYTGWTSTQVGIGFAHHGGALDGGPTMSPDDFKKWQCPLLLF